jgi:hypothetical protein
MVSPLVPSRLLKVRDQQFVSAFLVCNPLFAIKVAKPVEQEVILQLVLGMEEANVEIVGSSIYERLPSPKKDHQNLVLCSKYSSHSGFSLLISSRVFPRTLILKFPFLPVTSLCFAVSLPFPADFGVDVDGSVQNFSEFFGQVSCSPLR